jgi:hypothetical protein
MATNYRTARQILSYDLKRALNSVGEDPKRKIIHHLDVDYGISLQKPVIYSAELERALYSMIGSGADIIIQMIDSAETVTEFR